MRMRFAKTHSTSQEDTRKVNAKATAQTVEVTADGEGLVSHAGAFLLTELADRLGLTAALSGALAPTRERRSAHDPGVVTRDLTVAIADGGDCVTDLGVLRGQQALFGAVASETTAHRVLKSIDSELLDRIRAARAAARARAWDAGARPATITLDVDATLIAAHSEKQEAAGNYKRGFGYHPLLCYLDETGEALAGKLRPATPAPTPPPTTSRSSSWRSSRSQWPTSTARSSPAPTPAGRPTPSPPTAARPRSASRSATLVDERLREAILRLPESAWTRAIDAEGCQREGAWVAELSDHVDLCEWPVETRLIVRRERPHPGAQFEIFDADGYRHTAFLTDQEGAEIAALELRHRRRARVEDEIRTGKDTGMRNLPFHDFAANQAWLELSLIAQDLLAHSKRSC